MLKATVDSIVLGIASNNHEYPTKKLQWRDSKCHVIYLSENYISKDYFNMWHDVLHKLTDSISYLSL